MNVYIKLSGIILGCILSSCYSYKPLINGQNVSPETIKEKVTVGKKYQIVTNDDMRMFIKVDSICEDRLIGNTRKKNYSIYFVDVESMRYRKFSTGKTLAAIIIPVGIFILLVESVTFSDY